MTRFKKLWYYKPFGSWQWCSIYYCTFVAFLIIWFSHLQGVWNAIFPNNFILHVLTTGFIDFAISFVFCITTSLLLMVFMGKH